MHADPMLLAPARRFDFDAQRALTRAAAALLLAVMMAMMLIGERPFAVGEVDKAAVSESGSMFNRLLVFGIFAASVPVAMVHLSAVLRLLARNAPAAVIVAWSCASWLWATHPDLTFRRGIAFAIVYTTLLILAAAIRSPRVVMRVLAAVFGLVTLLNIYVLLVIPEASASPIGETGISDSKNVAGTVAMLAVISLGVNLVLPGRWWQRLAFAGIYALAWYFLILTQSKTSIGLAAVITLVGPFLYALVRARSAVRALALIAGLAVGVGGTTLATAQGATIDDITLLLFGDLTFSLRTPIWAAVVDTIALRPWLGHGFGSFWDVGGPFNPLHSPAWNEFFMDPQVINTAHSGYLDLMLQTGTIGLGLGLVVIARCLVRLYQGAVVAVEAPERVATLGLLCLAVCLALNNLLESYLFMSGMVTGYLFFLLTLCADWRRWEPA